MAQDLTVNIKTTSDVPQAMDKAKSATVSFGKQVDDIQKKFSTAFKDIAFAFVAPIVLLNSAINYIGAAIEKTKADIKEAYDYAADAESKYVDAETRNLAQRQKAEGKDKKDREMGEAGTKETFKKELEKPGMRDKVADEIGGFRGFRLKFGLDANSAEAMSGEKDVQEVLRKMSKAAGPLADTTAAKAGTFKGPEGFSNVVGVGANPVMEAMNAQLEEQRKTNTLLGKIAGDSGATSWMNSTPSRSAMLTGK